MFTLVLPIYLRPSFLPDTLATKDDHIDDRVAIYKVDRALNVSHKNDSPKQGNLAAHSHQAFSFRRLAEPPLLYAPLYSDWLGYAVKSRFQDHAPVFHSASRPMQFLGSLTRRQTLLGIGQQHAIVSNSPGMAVLFGVHMRPLDRS
jgi:hypothetical protein